MRLDLFRLTIEGKLQPILRLAQRDSRSAVPDEVNIDAPVCERHDWRPERVGSAPRPRSSECPDCKREAMQRREEYREEIEVEHPLNTRDVGFLGAAGDRWRQKQRDAGIVIPHSFEEERALARIAELREIEQEREEKREARRRRMPYYAHHR